MSPKRPNGPFLTPETKKHQVKEIANQTTQQQVNWLQTKELALSPTCVGGVVCPFTHSYICIGVGIWPYVPKQLNKDKCKVSNDCQPQAKHHKKDKRMIQSLLSQFVTNVTQTHSLRATLLCPKVPRWTFFNWATTKMS